MGKTNCKVCGDEPCDGLHALEAIKDGTEDVVGSDAGPCCTCCPAYEWVEDVAVASAVMDANAIGTAEVEAFHHRAPTRWTSALVTLTKLACERRAAETELPKLEEAVMQATAAVNRAYRDRAIVVVTLAAVVASLGGRVGVAEHPVEDPTWDADWRTILFIEVPCPAQAGASVPGDVVQASWHFHDNDRDLLAGFPQYPGEWDGHTTVEKYERIHRAVAALLATRLAA